MLEETVAAAPSFAAGADLQPQAQLVFPPHVAPAVVALVFAIVALFVLVALINAGK